jgi:hypothetical protein
MKKSENIKISDLVESHFFKNEDLEKYKYLSDSSIGYENWNSEGIHYIFKINNTIHYNAVLSNNFEIYNQYIQDGWNINREDLFRQILNCEDDEKLLEIEPIKVEYLEKYEKYLIIDGLHRVSYLLNKYGEEYILKIK